MSPVVFTLTINSRLSYYPTVGGCEAVFIFFHKKRFPHFMHKSECAVNNKRRFLGSWEKNKKNLLLSSKQQTIKARPLWLANSISSLSYHRREKKRHVKLFFVAKQFLSKIFFFFTVKSPVFVMQKLNRLHVQRRIVFSTN